MASSVGALFMLLYCLGGTVFLGVAGFIGTASLFENGRWVFGSLAAAVTLVVCLLCVVASFSNAVHWMREGGK